MRLVAAAAVPRNRSTVGNGRPRRSPSHRRAAVATGLAVVTVGLVGATAAFTADRGTTVRLSVDGRAATVETHGSTVEDVLRSADVKVGEHDLVTPARASAVRDGDHVAVRHAKQLELVVDGNPRTVWVLADDVESALDEAGVAEGAFVSTSRSRSVGDGLTVDVRLPKQVTVAVDGATTPRTTTAATVGDLLAESGVLLGPADGVVPAEDTPIAPGLAIGVIRVTTADVVLPFPTERRADAGLLKGDTKVVAAGANGVARQVWHVSTAGSVATPTLVGSSVVTAPAARVIAVGTKPRLVAVAAAPASAVSRNWGALAACESGGDPTAVSPSGTYYGLYQFSLSTWRGVGGSGLPSQASAAEQTARAQLLYSRRGASPWPVCGVYL